MIAALTREVAQATGENRDKASHWKQQWRDSFTQLAPLLEFLQLNPSDFATHALEWQPNFSLRVPRAFAERMAKADPADPLLLQVLPQAREHDEVTGFVSDPVNDLSNSPLPGLIHKYRSRALLIAAATCAINCRYCFRRDYPYSDAHINRAAIEQAESYLLANPQINELILSGGDPLALDTTRLAEISQRLLALPQIRRLRLHTRTPVVLPARLDAEFVAWVHSLSKPLVMVLHSNHANEWADINLRKALHELRAAGVTLLNQAVLLRGINDQLSAQVALSEALFDAGVLPYYLNLLDPVAGSAHFYVEQTQALQLYQQMSAELPGFLLPKLVRDVVGTPAKQQVGYS